MPYEPKAKLDSRFLWALHFYIFRLQSSRDAFCFITSIEQYCEHTIQFSSEAASRSRQDRSTRAIQQPKTLGVLPIFDSFINFTYQIIKYIIHQMCVINKKNTKSGTQCYKCTNSGNTDIVSCVISNLQIFR